MTLEKVDIWNVQIDDEITFDNPSQFDEPKIELVADVFPQTSSPDEVDWYIRTDDNDYQLVKNYDEIWMVVK